MTYVIISTSNFDRGLRKLSGVDRTRSRKVIDDILRDPYSYRELSGRYNELRSARFGDHRIIYAIRESAKEIVLLAVEARSSVYGR